MSYLGNKNSVALYDSYTKDQAAPITRSRKNLLINGGFLINQREALTKAQSVGVYGFDRWKGHANGIEQIVEGAGLSSSNVTLSWVGTGTGSINGTSGVSPLTVSVLADANISVVVPDTSNKVQLEIGDTATDFEYRHIGEELALCQRYYQRFTRPDGNGYMHIVDIHMTTSTDWRGSFSASPMRSIPTFSVSGSVEGAGSGLGTCSIIGLSDGESDFNTGKFLLTGSSTGGTAGNAGSIRFWNDPSAYFELDAEL